MGGREVTLGLRSLSYSRDGLLLLADPNVSSYSLASVWGHSYIPLGDPRASTLGASFTSQPTSQTQYPICPFFRCSSPEDGPVVAHAPGLLSNNLEMALLYTRTLQNPNPSKLPAANGLGCVEGTTAGGTLPGLRCAPFRSIQLFSLVFGPAVSPSLDLGTEVPPIFAFGDGNSSLSDLRPVAPPPKAVGSVAPPNLALRSCLTVPPLWNSSYSFSHTSAPFHG